MNLPYNIYNVSEIPLDKSEVTKLLRRVIRREGDFLEGNDKILSKYLSGVIRLDDDFRVIDPDHQKSLDYLDSITGVIGKFDAEAEALIISELEL
jgi:hypothetical protein